MAHTWLVCTSLLRKGTNFTPFGATKVINVLEEFIIVFSLSVSGQI